MSDQISNEQMDQIIAHLTGERKIEAIKVYREATGQGLKEAKDFVELLAQKLFEQDPEKYANLSPSKMSGCSSAALLFFVAVSSTAWWLLA